MGLEIALLCGFLKVSGIWLDALRWDIGGYGWTRTTDLSIMSAAL